MQEWEDCGLAAQRESSRERMMEAHPIATSDSDQSLDCNLQPFQIDAVHP